MSRVVLDSSALLAYMQNEPGGDQVAKVIPSAVISSVNVAEVVTKMVAGGGDPDSVVRLFREIDLEIADFTTDLAFNAGALAAHTRQCGLSLGDRACLALARREGAPVLTTDRIWSKLNVGVTIELIR
jgi:ribonuclease VapC